MFNDRLKETAKRFDKAMQALSTYIIGREAVLSQIKLALLTREHVLLEGPPGIAKSYLAAEVFRLFEGARVFRIQCTRKMTEDSLVGPPNVKILREEGRFIHNTEDTIVDCNLAFVDEFMDLTSGAMRALLEVLNERTFSRGAQCMKARLSTCIATTNFDRSKEEEIEAVLDRFMFKAKLTKLESMKHLRKMLEAQRPEHPVTFPFSDLLWLQKQVDEVEISDLTMDAYLELCTSLKNLTDRKIKKGLSVIKAHAVLDGRKVASVEDLSALGGAFCICGDSNSENQFGAIFQPIYSKAHKEATSEASALLVKSEVSSAHSEIMCAEDYDAAKKAACRMNEILQAFQSSGNIPPSIATILSEALDKADKLYEESEQASSER